jgi:hypothetical protein
MEENKSEVKYVYHYAGVGGWLLFFCISIIVISPLTNAIGITRVWFDSYPYINSYPSMAAVLIIQTVNIVTLIFLCIFTGFRLVLIHPRAVGTAKVLLFYILCSSVIVSTAVYFIAPDYGFEYTNIANSVVYFAIWFSYFKKSVRVKNTYQIVKEETVVISENEESL